LGEATAAERLAAAEADQAAAAVHYEQAKGTAAELRLFARLQAANLRVTMSRRTTHFAREAARTSTPV